jgi:hypothetical protein
MLKFLGLKKKARKIKTISCNTIHHQYIHTRHNKVYQYVAHHALKILSQDKWIDHISPDLVDSFRESLETVLNTDLNGFYGYKKIIVHCDDVYTGIFLIEDSTEKSAILEITMTV